MDRGRQIDHVQNTNAMAYDKFNKGRTCVKIANPSGGKCHFSLGWDYIPDENEVQQKKKGGKKRFDNSNY